MNWTEANLLGDLEAMERDMTSSETTFNDAELIARLRSLGRDFDHWDTAADRIEALTAENTKLHDHIVGVAKDTHKIMVGYEAKLTKAVKLIDLAVELARWDLNPKLRHDMINFTADLKGESHD